MDRPGIHTLLRELGAHVTQDMGEWVMCRCLLAPWTHESGGDSHLSFGVSVKTEGKSIYHCFTCGKGTLRMLVERLAAHSGENYDDLIDELDRGEELGPPAREWRERSAAELDVLGPPIPQDWLNVYSVPFRARSAIDGTRYLMQREIGAATCSRLQIRYDEEERRILFPVMDFEGNLYGFSGRSIDENAEPRVKDYHGLKKRHLLLGAQFVTDKSKVIVVEGLFDFATMHQLGFSNTVAAMHAGLTQQQVALLTGLNKPVVLMFDNDQAGRQATADAVGALANHLAVSYVMWDGSLAKDPGDMRDRNLVSRLLSYAELA